MRVSGVCWNGASAGEEATPPQAASAQAQSLVMLRAWTGAANKRAVPSAHAQSSLCQEGAAVSSKGGGTDDFLAIVSLFLAFGLLRAKIIIDPRFKMTEVKGLKDCVFIILLRFPLVFPEFTQIIRGKNA